MTDRPLAPTRAQLEDLKARHIAFLMSRLRAPQARDEWRVNVARGLTEILRMPLASIVDASTLDAALDAALSRALFDDALRPALARFAREAHTYLVAQPGRIGDHVPAAARDAIDALVARHDLLPPRLIREVTEQEAVREVMRDVLYDALKQFSERVNPFVADWGLPSLLKRLGPFGMAGVGKSFDSMRAEFEKRLDPEIRKFLQGFAREALKQVADTIITRGDTPPFVTLRKQLAAWLLEQRFADVLLDAKGAAEVADIGLVMASHLLGDGALRSRRRALIEGFLATHGGTPLGDLISAWGLPATPPAALVEALADATYPVLAAALGTEAARLWLSSLVAEFYDGLVASDEAPPQQQG